jgi:hypothetical protein
MGPCFNSIILDLKGEVPYLCMQETISACLKITQHVEFQQTHQVCTSFPKFPHLNSQVDQFPLSSACSGRLLRTLFEAGAGQEEPTNTIKYQ